MDLWMGTISREEYRNHELTLNLMLLYYKTENSIWQSYVSDRWNDETMVKAYCKLN